VTDERRSPAPKAARREAVVIAGYGSGPWLIAAEKDGKDAPGPDFLKRGAGMSIGHAEYGARC
jgi:hypothetical protein